MSKILILSYTFPPSPAIGGRRWAKFAKYFDRMGHDVCVLTSDLGHGKKSPWQKDIATLMEKGKVHYLNNGYPAVLDQYPERITDKLKYRLAIARVKKEVEGNFYDRSSFWKNNLFPELEKKIAEGYHTVLATGAPFQYLYYLTDMFAKHPQVKFYSDIRDPWANNKTAYGFDSLSEKRKQKVVDMEQKMVNEFDHVVTVYDATTDYFKNRSDKKKTKFHTIANGYDPEDFDVTNYDLPKGDKIKFVLTGSLYDPALHIFKSFIEALLELKESNPAVFNKFQFDFYGRTNRSYAPYFDNPALQGVMKHHGLVDISQVFEKIQAAHLGLLFLTDDMNYSKSTKYYEYVALKRKIAVFSTPGDTGREVEEQQIGYALNPGNMVNQFLKIYEDFNKGGLAFPQDFDSSPYNVEHLAQEYIKLIQNG